MFFKHSSTGCSNDNCVEQQNHPTQNNAIKKMCKPELRLVDDDDAAGAVVADGRRMNTHAYYCAHSDSVGTTLDPAPGKDTPELD